MDETMISLCHTVGDEKSAHSIGHNLPPQMSPLHHTCRDTVGIAMAGDRESHRTTINYVQYSTCVTYSVFRSGSSQVNPLDHQW